jgi:hypothetical protein
MADAFFGFLAGQGFITLFFVLGLGHLPISGVRFAIPDLNQVGILLAWIDSWRASTFGTAARVGALDIMVLADGSDA